MNWSRFATRLILFFVLATLISELALRFRRGLPPLESDKPLFKSHYEEIYQKFFKKVRLPDGGVVYRSQRKQEVEESFPEHKIKGMKRIFVLGGSVAYSFSYQMDRGYIRELLESSIPGAKFEVIGCGMAAYDSYRESIIHREILNYEPDFIILMSGNNEYYVPVRVNLWAYRLNLFFRNLYVYRILQDNFLSWGRNHGMITRPTEDKRLIIFENNLKIMMRRAKKRRVPMAVCTLPANFRDCPPTSFPIWQNKQFFLAWDTLYKKEFEEARSRFEQFIVAYPEDPFGYYFLAKSYEGLKNYSQAKEYYLKAVDLDVRPSDRCSPRRNGVIRRLSLREGTALIDLEKLFIGMAPYGLSGDELFVDNCHWWNDYRPLVYEEVARSIIEYYRPGLRTSFLFSASLDQWPKDIVSKRQELLSKTHEDPGDKAFRKILQVPERIYNKIKSFRESKEYSLQRSPFCNIDFIDERTIAFIQRAYQLSPELFDDSLSLKKRIFTKISENPWLPKEVPWEFERVWLVILYHIGEALRRLGQPLKAVGYFNEVINVAGGGVCLPYLGRALAYHEIGQVDKAKIDLEEIMGKSCQHPLIGFYRESSEI